MNGELPVVVIERRSLGMRFAAVAVAAGLALSACGNDSENDVPLGDGTESTTTTTTPGTNAEGDMWNPFNPSAEELAAFDCVDEDNERFGITISELNGNNFVEQVLPSRIPVEISERDPFHRETSDSLDSPVTVDLTNNDEVRAELAANFCAKPALLAATLHMLANSELRGEIIGENAKMLEKFVGITADEASAMLTNPHNEDVFPSEKAKEYVEANLAATEEREKYAEYLVAVLADFQARGNFTGLNLYSPYALAQKSNFNPTAPATYSEANYKGSAFLFDLTVKGEDCVDLTLGFNTGAENDGKHNDGDKRPVFAEVGEVCDTPEHTPTPPSGEPEPETPPTNRPNKNPVPPVGANTNPSAGGSPEEGNDPENDSDDDGYGPGDSRPSVPAPVDTTPEVTADTTPATTGTLAPGTSVVANGNNETPEPNEDPAQGGIEGDPGAPQD